MGGGFVISDNRAKKTDFSIATTDDQHTKIYSFNLEYQAGASVLKTKVHFCLYYQTSLYGSHFTADCPNFA